MTQSICILGRQPALGFAELESLFGSKAVEPVGQYAALVDVDPKEVNFERIGGSIKLCKLLTYLPTTELPGIIKYVSDTLPQHFSYVPAGKIHIGLSFYGFNFNPGKINASALGLKKNLKSSSRGVRIVPNKQPELNAAQIIHNQLTGKNGMELVFIKWGKRTVLAQTTAIQDIEAYAARDQARPKRDAKVGMLPPKLAQTLINLTNPSEKATLLDPFCGTGVVLQEALLMGYNVIGTDLEPRMIEYSEANLKWLEAPEDRWKLEIGDATSHQWDMFDSIACETYLGRPFSALPAAPVLDEVMRDVDVIHRKFLKNVAKQTKTGFRMCIAVPAWKKPNTGRARTFRASAAQGAIEQRTEPYMKYGEGAAEAATQRSAANKSRLLGSAQKSGFATDSFWHLPVLDSLEELGYTRVGFVHASNSDLIYHRDNQIVGRELVTLIRK